MRHLPLLIALAALAGCGAYPQPFAGNPGRMGAQLSLPPPPRLVVIPPTSALLGTRDATVFATDIADALADHAIPAIAGTTTGVDWRLTTTAELQGGQVRPTYTLVNPKGVPQGSTTGPAITAQTWSQAEPTALKLVAGRDAQAISDLLDRVKAAVQQSDPNSLVNRPARLVLGGITGAPGDGNAMLRTMIVRQLGGLGIVVQDTRKDADFTLKAKIVATPSGTAGQTRVEIQWTVTDPYGREIGHLLQLNDVPNEALSPHWGDMALVVAQEAAGGVRDVIANTTTSRTLAGKPKPHPAPAS